jgi:hypothetical protein
MRSGRRFAGSDLTARSVVLKTSTVVRRLRSFVDWWNKEELGVMPMSLAEELARLGILGLGAEQPQGILASKSPQGILGAATANPALMRQFANQRSAYPRQQMDTPQKALDLGAGLLGMVPGIGDAMGLAADVHRYSTEPESRSMGNYGLSLLGLLPFMPGMTVFHGSPHKFDKFDSSKIGTGEGFQEYGVGHYFAENPAVADSYKQGGSVYKVDLPDEQIVKMMDWEKPLSQQPENVKQALAKLKQATGKSERFFEPFAGREMNGMQLYRALSSTLGDEGAAKVLREAGIPGISYLDQGSRAANKGTRNFVVFDDSVPKILGSE